MAVKNPARLGLQIPLCIGFIIKQESREIRGSVRIPTGSKKRYRVDVMDYFPETLTESMSEDLDRM